MVIPGNYADTAGNPGLGGSSANFAVDTDGPRITTITLSDNILSSSDVLAVTIKFSEAVINFYATDIDLSGAAVQWISLDMLSPDEYRAIFSPLPGYEQSLNQLIIHGSQYADQAGNVGSDAYTPIFAVDSVAPTPHIANSTTLSNMGGFDFSVLFDEPVIGFSLVDLKIAGVPGSISYLGESIDGKSFDFHFTPMMGSQASSASIYVSGGGYLDLAGNIGQASQASLFSVDAISPAAVITLSDTALTLGESLNLALHFSEPVNGFDVSDIDIGGLPGTLGNLSQTAAGDYLITFTPNANVTVANGVITINGSYTDIAGNPGINQISGNFTIDTKSPSVAIGLSDTYLTRGESETLTFTFSEEVAGFTANDVRLDGMAVSLTNFQEIETGKKFTAIYAPANDVLDSSNIFSVASGSYSDVLGNPGAAASSVNINIDTLGKSFYGTTGNDVIQGTAGADRISGVPQSGAGGGKDSSDLLMGLGGVDVFVLGNHSTAFYNDGNNSTAGAKDFAAIGDFSVAEGDKIEVKAGTYFFSALSIGKLSGAGLYLDTNNSGAWDAKDELIGFLVGVNPGSVSAAHDLISV
jgi:large repetitive protein